MSAGDGATRCVLCGGPASTVIPPRRSTISRGPDPDDPSFSLTGVLPDIDLCEKDHDCVVENGTIVGWCDDERCRCWGDASAASPCGKPYVAV